MFEKQGIDKVEQAQHLYRRGFTSGQIAVKMRVTDRTILRWLHKPLPPPEYWDTSWMRHGLCGQIGGDAWALNSLNIKAAKEVCHRCEVMEQCRAYALAHDELTGVWGGLSDGQRKRMR